MSHFLTTHRYLFVFIAHQCFKKRFINGVKLGSGSVFRRLSNNTDPDPKHSLEALVDLLFSLPSLFMRLFNSYEV